MPEQAVKDDSGFSHLHRVQVCKHEKLNANRSKRQQDPMDLITATPDVISLFSLVNPV